MRKDGYVEAKDRFKLSAGEVIKISREMMEMTQAELATKAGIRQSHLSEIERGKRPIGKTIAMKLAYALELPPAHILFRGDEFRAGVEEYEGLDAVASQIVKCEKKRENEFLSQIVRRLKAVREMRGAPSRTAVNSIIKVIQRQQKEPPNIRELYFEKNLALPKRRERSSKRKGK